MLPGNRSNRVGDQILREVADLLMRKVKDPRCKGATLTGVRMSRDLRHAKVYYSVIGSPNEVARVQEGLDRAKGYIKREIGLRMDLKYIPEIVFRHDPSLAEGNRMEKLFEKLHDSQSADAGKDMKREEGVDSERSR